LPNTSVPNWLPGIIGGVSEFAWRTFGLKGEPPLTRFSAMIMSRDCILKDDKARAEMGYRPVISVDDGMRQLAA
jgi:nucleoside-diphosphate-sugar epimerase